jgi:hypothetical protein
LFSKSAKLNPELEKHKQIREQTMLEFDEEEEDENPLAFKMTKHMKGSLH